MAAHPDAATSAAWRTALESLLVIPRAVADRSLPKEHLHFLASQAEVDCSGAELPAANEASIMAALRSQQRMQVALGQAIEQGKQPWRVPMHLVVDTLQIPLHLSKAVALLLPIPFTFHMAVELLRHLGILISVLQSAHAAADPSTPRRALTVSTQIAASGLLQQLPAALKSAQQQLRQLQPQGWCGVECHFCMKGLRHAPTMGVTEAGTMALQTTLLQACTQLLDFWPGTLGALGSPAVGPTLIPAAQLAISSLQYACRQAGEVHKPSSSSNRSSSSPPLALMYLGRSALNACAALTCAADAFSDGRQPTAASSSSQPQYCEELLSSPQLLSAAVATINADVYGQHDAESVIAASDPFVQDLSCVGAVLHLQVPLAPDGNLPAAAWHQLSVREGQLQPGQGLLPPLQQRLLDTLGCNSKGFLWLAPLWKAREQKYLVPAAAHVCSVIAESMKVRMRSSDAGAGSHTPARVTDAVLRLFLLLPALTLRMELHQQRVCARSGSAEQDVHGRSRYHTLIVSVSCVEMLCTYRKLQDLVASTGGGTGVGGAAGRASVTTSQDADFAAMLHEVLQLLTHLLLGVMQTPQPGMSSSNGNQGSTDHPGRQDSTGTGTSSSPDAYSSTRASSSASTRTNAEPHEHTISSAAAATVISSVIALLLPAATQAVMGQAASTRTNSTTASGSGRVRNSSMAATWVPLLLRLLGALEQAMRFEAQWGPSKQEVEAKIFTFWGELATLFPHGAAWGATFVLLSQAAHAELDWLNCPNSNSAAAVDGGDDSDWNSKPALLQWMLDNTPTRQLYTVQQRVLSVLCTAAKAGLSAEGSNQLGQVTTAYSCIFHTAWSVLARLLPQKAAPTASNAAAATAGMCSSSSSQGPGRTQQQIKAAAAVGQPNPACSTTQGEAALSWLSLVGRCFLQASNQIDSTLKQCAVQTVLTRDTQQQDQDQLGGTARATARLVMLARLCQPGLHTLLQGIARAAVLMAAAAGGPALQLPQHKPGGIAGIVRYDEIDESMRVSDQEQHQLQGAGQQLAEYCSSLGLDLTAVQQSTWALAEAATAAAPAFLGVKTCIAASLTERTRDDLPPGAYLYILLESGVPAEHAMAVERSVTDRQGARRVSEATAAALLHSPAVQAYWQQLMAAGVALSTLPTATACNNPRCSSLSGVSEQQGVSGKACRCSGCHLAFYCQRSCQKQHWAAHKPVCKAVQATATAAAVTGS